MMNMDEIKVFYSEDELKNIISKNEMNSVEICPIHSFDEYVLVNIGNTYYRKMTLEEFARFVFPNFGDDIIIRTTDYGIFVWHKDGEGNEEGK